MATKYTKIDQMAVKYSNIFHCNTLQNLPKTGIFGSKICHLATQPSKKMKLKNMGEIRTSKVRFPGDF
jgi:hypothetical protein